MRLTRIIPMLVSLTFVTLLSVSVASAAPTNAPNAETIEITCDNGESYTVVVNGNGSFTPGHIVAGEGRVLIPVAFTVEATDGDGNVIFSESIAKKGQMKGLVDDLFTCTFGETFEENGETFTFTGTVTVFSAPRN
jgi:hypothetical protein